jgi:hypothetical protein
MNSTETIPLTNQHSMEDGVKIGLAIGRLANRHAEQQPKINFSTLLKALLELRDKQLLTDEQFSELIETACSVLIEKRVSFAVEKVIEHQINVSLLTKMLGK